MSSTLKASALPKRVLQFDVRDNGPKTKTLTANIYIMKRIFVSCIIKLGFLIKLLSTCVNVDVKSVNESVKQHPCTLV